MIWSLNANKVCVCMPDLCSRFKTVAIAVHSTQAIRLTQTNVYSCPDFFPVTWHAAEDNHASEFCYILPLKPCCVLYLYTCVLVDRSVAISIGIPQEEVWFPEQRPEHVYKRTNHTLVLAHAGRNMVYLMTKQLKTLPPN